MKLQGEFLVRGGSGSMCDATVVAAEEQDENSMLHPVLASDVSLSFWGGIDPVSGIVIDTSHPLAGQCVTDTILCLPSGRGSCTASQVLLELILNRQAPAALILRDVDPLACVGAIVAQEIFALDHVLPILHLGEEEYRRLLDTAHSDGSSSSDAAPLIGAVAADAGLYLGEENDHAVLLKELSESSPSSAMETEMTLTPDEKKRLSQCETEAERMALGVIFKYARLTSSTPSYVEVSQAHIDGCTFIGPGGLDFVQRLVQAGGKVRVPTTLNSQSTDRRRWKELGVPEQYAQNANALGDAYLELGCQPSFTCAPYLLLPGMQVTTSSGGTNSSSTSGDRTANDMYMGQDWVWGESNAVVFANTVLGARTDKTADYLDIVAALTGIVPREGMHLDENRRPTIVLDARTFVHELEELGLENLANDLDSLFPTLGHLCGTLSDGRVPVLVGLESWDDWISVDYLKSFCAAFGTTGSSPLIHIAGITPEARDMSVVEEWVEGLKAGNSVVAVTAERMQETLSVLDRDDDADGAKVDLVALGNPHLSVTECERLVELVQGPLLTNNVDMSHGTAQPQPIPHRKHPDIRVMACISRAIQSQAESAGHIQPLRDFGIELVNDTCWCMLLDPPVIPASDNATILTNSGKYAHYGPGLTSRRFRFGSLADCIQTASTGRFTGSTLQPSWLQVNSGRASRSFHTTSASVAPRLRPHGSPDAARMLVLPLSKLLRKLR